MSAGWDPDLEHVSERLVELQTRFGWGTDAQRFDPVEGWERRSGARLDRMKGWPNGPDVVVKRGEWADGDAERIYTAMDDLAASVTAAATEDGRAVRPLAWGTEPEMVVMPYVEGVDLVSILRVPDHSAWQDEARVLRGWMTQAGIMLASFQARVDADSTGVETARHDVIEVARKLGVSIDRVLADVDLATRTGRVFGDYGPGNFHAAPGRVLYLLDPPEKTVPGPVHRDLANFLFELRRQLAGRGYTRSRPVRGRYQGMREAFLDGYSSEWRGGRLDASDLALIDLYELRRARGMARKRWPDRPGDALWFAGSALRRRWSLTRRRGRLSRSPG